MSICTCLHLTSILTRWNFRAVTTTTSFLDTSTVPRSTTTPSCTAGDDQVTYTFVISPDDDKTSTVTVQNGTTTILPATTGHSIPPCGTVVFTTLHGSPTGQPQVSTSTSFLDTSTVPRSTAAPSCTAGEPEVTYTFVVSDETTSTVTVRDGTTTLLPTTTGHSSPACGVVVYTTLKGSPTAVSTPSITPNSQKLVSNDNKGGAVVTDPFAMGGVLTFLAGALGMIFVA